MQAFADMGVDILFLEAPRDEHEMTAFCEQIPGPKLANMLEEGLTPLMPPTRLEAMGYKIAAYPLTLLNTAIFAMQEALEDLKQGATPSRRVDFDTVQKIVGFPQYDDLMKGYAERYGPKE